MTPLRRHPGWALSWESNTSTIVEALEEVQSYLGPSRESCFPSDIETWDYYQKAIDQSKELVEATDDLMFWDNNALEDEYQCCNEYKEAVSRVLKIVHEIKKRY